MRTVIALVAILTLSGCALIQPSPARTNDAYSSKAEKTIESVRSSVQSALITADLLRRGRITANAATIALSDMTADAHGAHSAFDRILPPTKEAGDTGDALSNVLDEVDNELGSLTDSARRQEYESMAEPAGELHELLVRLQVMEAELP